MHGMVNVHMPLGILTDAMGVAVLDMRRQFTPIVEYFVGMLAAADEKRWLGCSVDAPLQYQ